MKVKRLLPMNSKALATLIVIVIMAIAPTLTTTAAAASSQSQQSSNPNDSTREGAPTTSVHWAKTYGGPDIDCAESVQQTSDGGYIVAGYTYSFGAGGADVWVLKLNSTGGVTWQKTYGGSGDDYASSVEQTSDGGYIVAGTTSSFGAGGYDVWVLKLSSTGAVTWQKSYGGTGIDEAFSVQQTSDGGYIVAGTTFSFGASGGNFWLLKLDSAGDVTWQKTYGGSGPDSAYSVQQTSDGGYIVAGTTSSFGVGAYDVWVLKLDSTGGVTWQKAYGGFDTAHSVEQTSDGGYIVAGTTSSFVGGVYHVWVLKLNSTGAVTWQKAYGGHSDDGASCVEQTSDGGYIVAGYTTSFGAGGADVWVLKLDSTGGVTWQKTYGGSRDDIANAVQQTTDGGYIVAGETTSFGAGFNDFWVLKLDSDGGIVWNSGSGASTHVTNATPSDSSATITTTSVTGVNSNATVQNTNATPQNTNATITVQATPGVTEAASPTQIIVVVTTVTAVVLLLIVAALLDRKRKPN